MTSATARLARYAVIDAALGSSRTMLRAGRDVASHDPAWRIERTFGEGGIDGVAGRGPGAPPDT